MPTITFSSDLHALVPDGTSVLDAAAQVGATRVECCGILPACGACRMTVVDGAEHLSAPDDLESEYRARKRLLPFERLACMAHAHGDVTVEMEG